MKTACSLAAIFFATALVGPPAEASTRLRVAHLSPDAPAVDVAVTGGPVLFENVEFRRASDAVAVDPGTYDLEVRVAGAETVALSVPGVTLVAGTNVSVFAIGLLSDETLAALPVVDVDEIFLRGDSNRDSRVNISDAVATLTTLFHGYSGVFCDDAADADDNGHVQITDAIFTLDYLFQGGDAPPPPFPEPGVDTTEDAIRCAL